MPIRSIHRLSKSAAVTASTPAARNWLMALLRHGERAGAPEAGDAVPARRTRRRRAKLLAVGRQLDAGGT
jgi:hypothetical protein